MYSILASTIFCLVAAASGDITADSPSKFRGARRLELRDALEYGGTRENKMIKGVAKLLARQSSPPITNVAKCDDFDGYFYVTPHNYTWQLQCTTNYEGLIISQANAIGFDGCIDACVEYNRGTSPGSCLGITFNGPNDNAQGLCTLYSDVTGVLLASEEGNVQDSALLILGPSGQIFATPQPDPSFSGAPSQPPTDDPAPTSTTSSAEMTTTPTTSTTTFTTTTAVSQTTTTALGTLFLTTTMTSTILVTSCPPGSSACFQGTASTSTSAVPPTTTSGASSSSQITSVSSGTLNNGGTATSSSSGSTMPTSSPASATLISSPTSTTSGAATVDAAQRTFTTLVPVTEYRVQIIEVCAATPTPCSQSSSTSTLVTYRTEVSCSPGPCLGIVPVTGFMVDAIAATGVCLVP